MVLVKNPDDVELEDDELWAGFELLLLLEEVELAEDEEDDPDRADTCELLLLLTAAEELEDVAGEDVVGVLGL